ncbi:serine hydrolase domain-containing protein [Desnuesiella massiliensis]|uniref:serine hydrolase domain-containing protein n=1 Tax=Desnuesiella massiliensis TaxID=1650662 RepID=UPI0006E21980|nr:serine hydrolase domain-containing protein [Desnuesiella massiliensis]
MHINKDITSKFSGLVEYTQKVNDLNGGSGTALIVIQRDRIVTEYYSGFHSHDKNARAIQQESQFNIASARKSYIGFAIALAVYQGKISSIDDLVIDYLPELDAKVMDKITIRHLLTHTHGIERNEFGHLFREFPCGTNWAYRGENILMLCEIVKRTTRKTVSEIINEYICCPLELKETGWKIHWNEKLVYSIMEKGKRPKQYLEATADGNLHNMFVSAREFAFWGYLHLKQGMIDGKQIAPKEIFEMATSVQSPKFENKELPQNGFLWFTKDLPGKCTEIGDLVPTGSYQIVGVRGALLLVIPSQELVVARMYNKQYNYSGTEGYLYYLREFGNEVIKCLK